MKKLLLALVCVAASLWCNQAAEEEGFRPLFNGKSFDGWKTTAKTPTSWKIDKGMLVLTGNNSYRGRVQVLDRKPGKVVWVAEAETGTFLGDIATFTGEPAIAECVAEEPTDVIEFDRSALRAMLASRPEFAETVLRTMMVRREWHEAHGYGVARLIAPRGSRRAFEVRDLLERNLIPVRWYDVDTDEESTTMLNWLQIPREETPVLVRNTTVQLPLDEVFVGLRARRDRHPGDRARAWYEQERQKLAALVETGQLDQAAWVARMPPRSSRRSFIRARVEKLLIIRIPVWSN